MIFGFRLELVNPKPLELEGIRAGGWGGWGCGGLQDVGYRALGSDAGDFRFRVSGRRGLKG